MNIKISTLTLAALCVFSTHTIAAEDTPIPLSYQDQSALEQIFAGDMDDGIQYHFAGDPEEEGALKLFVKDAATQYDLHSPDADSMSKINPAAGIQLHFEF